MGVFFSYLHFDVYDALFVNTKAYTYSPSLFILTAVAGMPLKIAIAIGCYAVTIAF